MENLDPPFPPNQGWENGAFLPFARLHPWFGGDGGLLFHFILSKIVAKLRSEISRRADVSFPVFTRPWVLDLDQISWTLLLV